MGARTRERVAIQTVEQGLTLESRVRALRVARGLSMVALAGLARTTIETVRACERGRVLGAQLGTLMRVANALGVSVGECFPLLAPPPARPNGAPRSLAAFRAGMAEVERDSAIR